MPVKLCSSGPVPRVTAEWAAGMEKKATARQEQWRETPQSFTRRRRHRMAAVPEETASRWHIDREKMPSRRCRERPTHLPALNGARLEHNDRRNPDYDKRERRPDVCQECPLDGQLRSFPG